jgi:L-seryl-tRNA(Ser) seleniumtransferase
MDIAALNRLWEQRVKRIATMVGTVAGVTTEIQIPEGGNRYPTLTVHWDENAWKFTVADCDRQLREGEPRIEVLTASNPSLVPAVIGRDPKTPRHNRLQIISMTMQSGEELVVGRRLRAILEAARKNAKG